MSAGTAYTKRYGGPFVDKPTQTTGVDSQFLNLVETALAQLIGVAPTVDGQVAQWDFANTRFGPALLLNKNIASGAAIAKSKLDFTGANGIVDADVASGAAIAQSKIAGLVAALSGITGTPGTIVPFAGLAVPSGYLLCDGSTQLRASFANLFPVLNPSKGTVTVTIASPGVFTLTAHGLVAGDRVFLETSGALPTGLSADTMYYVIAAGLTSNSFQVSATLGGAAINTSGSQSPTHTLFVSPHGVADVTHFNVPDFSGRTLAGWAASGHADVQSMAANEGSTLANRRPKHPHAQALGFAGSSGATSGASATHTHSGTTSGQSATHSHSVAIEGGTGISVARWGDPVGGGTSFNTGNASGDHTHDVTTGGPSVDHTHTITPAGTITGSIGAAGTANDAPAYGVVKWLVKT